VAIHHSTYTGTKRLLHQYTAHDSSRAIHELAVLRNHAVICRSDDWVKEYPGCGKFPHSTQQYHGPAHMLPTCHMHDSTDLAMWGLTCILHSSQSEGVENHVVVAAGARWQQGLAQDGRWLNPTPGKQKQVQG
jgi:hypothetical protein